MSYFKQLSTRYFSTAKKLGFTWMDLVKRTTREKVINKVIKYKMKKIKDDIKKDSVKIAIRKAKLDLKEGKLKATLLKEKEDMVRKEHEKIMKKQKQTADVLIFQR